jgi:hypothetical protein
MTVMYFRATFSAPSHPPLAMTVADTSAASALAHFRAVAKSAGFDLTGVKPLGAKLPNRVLGVFRLAA